VSSCLVPERDFNSIPEPHLIVDDAKVILDDKLSRADFPSRSSIFLRDKSGRRPVYGGTEKFQTDPYWKDYILFYEYFHGDNGAGLGASHQTGWTGLVAKLIEFFGRIDGEQLLSGGKAGADTDTG